MEWARRLRTLKALADELLKGGGIDIQPRADEGAYMRIPFSAETMPSFEEQMAFRASRSARRKGRRSILQGLNDE